MGKLRRVSLACAAMLMSMSAVAHANLITNGSFELGSYSGGSAYNTLAAGSTAITGWTVKSGSIDWINTYWQASDGQRSLALAGLYPHGVISTIFSTLPGETYRVQFDMAGNPDRDYVKTMVAVNAVSAPDSNNTVQNYNRIVTAILMDEPEPIPTSSSQVYTFVQTGHTKQNMGWESKFFDFVAQSASTELLFGDLTQVDYPGDNPGEAYGAALDNVRAELQPVPEPSTFLLLGAGLAGIGWLRRRKQRR